MWTRLSIHARTMAGYCRHYIILFLYNDLIFFVLRKSSIVKAALLLCRYERREKMLNELNHVIDYVPCFFFY